MSITELTALVERTEEYDRLLAEAGKLSLLAFQLARKADVLIRRAEQLSARAMTFSARAQALGVLGMSN
jgi:hypothetical protein